MYHCSVKVRNLSHQGSCLWYSGYHPGPGSKRLWVQESLGLDNTQYTSVLNDFLINKNINKIYFLALQFPQGFSKLEKNILWNIVIQFYGQVQRIITFGHISLLLLSQKSKEVDFSLLFLPLFPHTIHITIYLSTARELCTLYLGQIQAR